MTIANFARKFTAGRTAVAVATLALTLSATTVPAVANAATAGPSSAWGPRLNLLSNPGHEHPGVYFAGRGEINVTWNWVPFWEEPPSGDNLRDQNYRTPEFRPVFASIYPDRVHTGGGSDRWFNFFALNHAAGIMQVVHNLPIGKPVRFSTWAQLWSSNVTSNPATSEQDGNMRLRVCILTDGGPRNMVSPNLVCSDWAQPYDKYAQISVDATPISSTVLALVQSDASIPVQHNDAYVDDSCFEVLPSAGAAGICLGAGFVPSAIDGNTMPQLVQAPIKAATAPAGTDPQAIVNTGKLNVRSSPVIAVDNILAAVGAGQVLNVTGRSADGAWFQIAWNGKSGWVYANLTTPNAAAKAAPVVK
jgi:Bacterial SH3 domain